MRTFLRGKVTLLFMMLGMLLAIPAIALADIVINDVATAGKDTIMAGNSTAIKYGIRQQNATQEGTGGLGGCNATASTPVKVYITAPAAVTLSGSDVQTDADGIPPDGKYLEFTDCANQTLDNGQVKTATFSSSTVGNHSITHQVVENFPGNYTNSADFTLKLNDNCPSGDTSGNLQDGKCTANTAPTAVADSYNATEDQQLTVSAPGVLSNDTDAENNPLTAVLVSGPSHAAASGFTLNANGSFSYTPAANYNGPDSFTYKAKDSNNAESNTVTVTITVASVNDVPTCQNVAIETDEDTQGSVAANCSDADGDTLTYAIEDEPADGTASVDGSDLKYDPELNFNGSDSFTYSASDGSASSAPADVDVTVNPVNDPPVAQNGTVTTDEDTTSNPFTLNASDVDGDQLTYTIVSGPTKGTLHGTGNSRTYEPNLNANGSDSFTFRANDGNLDSNVATVNITINPVNDAPDAPNSAPALASGSNTPNNGVFKLDWGAATDVDGDTLSYELQHKDADDNGFTTVTGAGSLNTLSHSFTATSKEDEGTWTYQVRASDGQLSSGFAGPSTAVKVDKSAPTFGACPTAGPFLVNSGTQQVTISAPNDPNLLDGSPGTGVANSTLTGSVDTNSTGAKTVTFTATDGVGNQASKTCTYNVNTHTFIGFSSPVDNPNYLNSMKAGQAVPLKWQLKDASGNPVTNLQNVTVTTSSRNCTSGVTGTDVVEEYATGSSSLQNLGKGYYQFNWASLKSYAGSCKTLTVNGVGVQQQAYFQFLK